MLDDDSRNVSFVDNELEAVLNGMSRFSSGSDCASTCQIGK